MITVVETQPFLRAASGILSDDERAALVDFLSAKPTAGEEIVGSGGVRKVRFATEGRGKSGGARVIYFYFDEGVPLYLLTCFAKSQKENLSRAEINDFAKMTAAIKQQARRRQ